MARMYPKTFPENSNSSGEQKIFEYFDNSAPDDWYVLHSFRLPCHKTVVFGEADFVVVGNIPYYITGPILEKVLNLPILPQRIVLLVQKEVAQKLTDKHESLLSLRVKNRAEVTAGPEVPKEKFTPPPKVDSQVIILKPHAPVVDDEVLRLIQRGFAAPRKKLVHNLAGLKSTEELKAILRKIGVDENARPGELSLLDWQNLAKNC